MKTNRKTAVSSTKESNPQKLRTNVQELQQEPEKRLRTDGYKKAFLQPTEFMARNGKSVYISREFHENISRIVFMLGNGKISISDYMNNVLMQHFQDFTEVIREVYDENIKPIL